MERKGSSVIEDVLFRFMVERCVTINLTCEDSQHFCCEVKQTREAGANIQRRPSNPSKESRLKVVDKLVHGKTGGSLHSMTLGTIFAAMTQLRSLPCADI